MRMTVKRIGMYLAFLLCICLCACSNADTEVKETKIDVEHTKEVPEESTKELEDTDIKIIEKGIVKEDYAIKSVSFRGESELIAFLEKTDKSGFEVLAYDIFKDKVSRSYTYECKPDGFFTETKDIVCMVCDNRDVYVYDDVKKNFMILDSKLEKKKSFNIMKEMKLTYIIPDGSGILYIDSENVLYEHDTESDSSLLIYAFDKTYEMKNCLGECFGEGIYLFDYDKDGESGYIEVDSEEHVTYDRGSVDYTIRTSGKELVFLDYYKDKSCIGCYSMLKPRVLELFKFDSQSELDDVRFFPSNKYAVTVYKEASGDYEFKVYDLSEGIFLEKISVDSSIISKAGIIDISPGAKYVMLTSVEKSGTVKKVYLWKLSVPTDAYDDNPADMF